MLLRSHGHHPIAGWKLEATQPNRTNKLQNSSKYTKKSKVDGTLPMLFFDFYKILTKHGSDWTRFQEPCIPRIPNDAHLAVLWQLTHNVQLNSMENGSEWCDCLDLRLAMMVGNIEPKLHTVCEITGFEQICKSLGRIKTLIQTMFLQRIDTYFSFWDLLPSFYLSNRFN